MNKNHERESFKNSLKQDFTNQFFAKKKISIKNNPKNVQQILQLKADPIFPKQTPQQLRQGIHILTSYDKFENYYTLQEKIGEGTCGMVYRCKRKFDEYIFAVKKIAIKDYELFDSFQKEYLALKIIAHPNIIKMEELFLSYYTNTVHIVMEYFESVELFDALQNMSYSEQQISFIIKQILAAVKTLHDNLICHRDLKPNNILVSYREDLIKITDFNVSKFDDQQVSDCQKFKMKMNTYTGTLAFKAPEMFNEMEYTEAVDIWAIGVMSYVMISGNLPFFSDYEDDMIQLIKQGKYDLNEKEEP